MGCLQTSCHRGTQGSYQAARLCWFMCPGLRPRGAHWCLLGPLDFAGGQGFLPIHRKHTSHSTLHDEVEESCSGNIFAYWPQEAISIMPYGNSDMSISRYYWILLVYNRQLNEGLGFC